VHLGHLTKLLDMTSSVTVNAAVVIQNSWRVRKATKRFANQTSVMLQRTSDLRAPKKPQAGSPRHAQHLGAASLAVYTQLSDRHLSPTSRTPPAEDAISPKQGVVNQDRGLSPTADTRSSPAAPTLDSSVHETTLDASHRKDAIDRSFLAQMSIGLPEMS